jgi:hypothetical protein
VHQLTHDALILRHQQGHATRVGRRSAVRVVLLIVLTATIFGSLEAFREGRGRWSALLVTVGLLLYAVIVLLIIAHP